MNLRRLGILGVVVAVMFGFSALIAQGAVTLMANTDGNLIGDGVDTETITLTAVEDGAALAAPDVVIATSLGDLTVVSCVTAGLLAGVCPGTAISAIAAASITVDDEALDADAAAGSYVLTVTLKATCAISTIITITAQQLAAGSGMSVTVLCSAPVAASTAAGDVCDIQGPLPAEMGPGAYDIAKNSGWSNDFLLEGRSYTFWIVVQSYVDSGSLNYFNLGVEIDDETGDGDITAHSASPAGVSVSVPNVDTLNGGVHAETTAAALTGCATGTQAAAWITVKCDRHGIFEITAYDANSVSDSITEEYICLDDPKAMTLSAKPATVESSPAISSVSHSLITAKLTDSSGEFIGEGYEVDWTTTGCKIDALSELEYEGLYKALFAGLSSSNPASAAAINAYLASTVTGHPGGSGTSSDNDTFMDGSSSISAAILHCEGAAAGTYTIQAQVEDDQFGQGDDNDITATTTVTVVGPAAFITMTADPTELVCGEKSLISVTITDTEGQNVSDHTRVELITNYGGVLGGTGSSLGFPGVNPVNPLSSSASETFGGVASGFLLTSTNHTGSYEVVAAVGGSHLGQYEVEVNDMALENAEAYLTANTETSSNVDTLFGDGLDELYDDERLGGERFVFTGNTGTFSTPVLTSQVTVTCTEAAAPEIVAPNTGTGTISPPNTGDAGLATSSAGTAMLFVIAGAVAFVLVGFAGFGFARR